MELTGTYEKNPLISQIFFKKNSRGFSYFLVSIFLIFIPTESFFVDFRDEKGYYNITGRMDDVINVTGHRLGTAEVEDILVSSKVNINL